ncbi:MAG TPA: transposase, partial [Herpetosiphonaceae bacterium]|nr:transposase [Herpetosiphonaceae bacterium]
RRHLTGETLQSIGRATGLARGTVRKYAHAECFPERAAPRPNPSLLDPYLPHLERRMAEGCENAMALWREVRDQGFRGTHRQVHRWVAERRTAPARRTPHKWLERTSTDVLEVSNAAPLPSPKQLAWLMVQPIGSLAPFAAAAVTRVEQDPETARVADLARRFTALVRACGRGQNIHPAPLDDLSLWLTDARACGVRPIETFAEGLQQDGAAVQAALTTPWSNGQAEGQITRLKLLKRTMYGRAGFDLLRRRILLAA